MSAVWSRRERVDRTWHYSDVIMGAIASPITSLTIVYWTVYSGTDQGEHQNSPSQAFVRVIDRSSVNSPHKGPVTRKMFPFDDVIMTRTYAQLRPDFELGMEAHTRPSQATIFYITYACFVTLVNHIPDNSGHTNHVKFCYNTIVIPTNGPKDSFTCRR